VLLPVFQRFLFFIADSFFIADTTPNHHSKVTKLHEVDALRIEDVEWYWYIYKP